MKVKKYYLVMPVIIIILFILSFIIALVIWEPERIIAFVNNRGESITEGFRSSFFDFDEVAEYNKPEQHFIDVEHYDIYVRLNQSEKMINGRVIVSATTTENYAGEIVFNMDNDLELDSIRLNGEEPSFSFSGNYLMVDCPDGGKFNLDIFYHGTPEPKGFGSFVFYDKDSLQTVFTLSEPVFASTWLPCNDINTDKATIDMHITADSCMVSVSNGNLVNVSDSLNLRTYHWQTVYDIAPYLITINTAPYIYFNDTYNSISGKKIPLEYYVFPGKLEAAKYDFAINKKALRVFEELYGEYPFPDEKYGVAEINWRYGAIEHQTITGMSTEYITGSALFDDVFVHELAHHWWGDAVTPKTWKDVWLSEGFATYSEALFYEKVSGRDGLVSTLNSKIRGIKQGKLYDPGSNLFSPLVYNKGAWVLHMLRKQLGDSAFFESLRNYYLTYRYKSASTDDFREVCENTSKQNLDKFFDQWLFSGTGLPQLDFSHTITQIGSQNQIEVKVIQLQEEYKRYELFLDVMFSDSTNSVVKTYFIDSAEQIFTDTLNFVPVSIKPDPYSWLLAEIVSGN